MSDAIASGSALGNSAPNVTEAYAFACMHCGHGWEQAYEIEHHVDGAGHPFVTYLANGAQVPSPLTRPSCQNCDGHLVRIMRSGQVSEAASRWNAPRPARAQRAERAVHMERAPHRTHHWSLLNFSLLNFLHRGHRESEPS